MGLEELSFFFEWPGASVTSDKHLLLHLMNAWTEDDVEVDWCFDRGQRDFGARDAFNSACTLLKFVVPGVRVYPYLPDIPRNEPFNEFENEVLQSTEEIRLSARSGEVKKRLWHYSGYSPYFLNETVEDDKIFYSASVGPYELSRIGVPADLVDDSPTMERIKFILAGGLLRARSFFLAMELKRSTATLGKRKRALDSGDSRKSRAPCLLRGCAKKFRESEEPKDAAGGAAGAAAGGLARFLKKAPFADELITRFLLPRADVPAVLLAAGRDGADPAARAVLNGVVRSVLETALRSVDHKTTRAMGLSATDLVSTLVDGRRARIFRDAPPGFDATLFAHGDPHFEWDPDHPEGGFTPTIPRSRLVYLTLSTDGPVAYRIRGYGNRLVIEDLAATWRAATSAMRSDLHWLMDPTLLARWG